MDFAPASIEFSTSSLTIETGLSTCLKHPLQLLHDLLTPGHHHEARRRSVQAMHDAGPQSVPQEAHLRVAPQEPVNQRAAPVSRRRMYPQLYVFKWKETANTKFYNVRKLDKLYVQGQFPNDYFVIKSIYGEERQGKDLSQCWAKTASNMLHWWFEQNKDYVEQYKQKAAIEAWKRPLYDYKSTRKPLS